MAKANINLPDGGKVIIEGTPEEISKIINAYATNFSAVNSSSNENIKSTKSTSKSKKKSGSSKKTKSAMSYIKELKDDDFFNQRRSLAEVQSKLEEEGHIYPPTHLSTPLRRLVTSKSLRRMKENNNWVYVNR